MSNRGCGGWGGSHSAAAAAGALGGSKRPPASSWDALGPPAPGPLVTQHGHRPPSGASSGEGLRGGEERNHDLISTDRAAEVCRVAPGIPPPPTAPGAPSPSISEGPGERLVQEKGRFISINTPALTHGPHSARRQTDGQRRAAHRRPQQRSRPKETHLRTPVALSAPTGATQLWRDLRASSHSPHSPSGGLIAKGGQAGGVKAP